MYLRNCVRQKDYIETTKRLTSISQMSTHMRRLRAITTVKATLTKPTLVVDNTATSKGGVDVGTAANTDSNFTNNTPGMPTTSATTTTSSRRGKSFHNKMPASNTSKITSTTTSSSFLLRFLAAVLLGTNLVICDSEFFQQFTNTTSTTIVNETRITTATPTLQSNPIEESANISLLRETTGTKSTTMSPGKSLTTTPDAESTPTTAETISLPSLLLQTTIFSSVTSESGASTAATTVSESDDSSVASTIETDDDSDASLVQPPSDSLTKGFSIPTFLPPFPEFAVADLPSNTVPPATTKDTMSSPPSLFAMGESLGSMSPDMLQQQQDQLYLDAYTKHQVPKKNLTMPATNVTVQMGSHAYMPCHIRRLMNKPVSWVRVRDGHILSVDQTTFIADQRFQSLFKGENEYTWSLQIKYVQANDEGWYECQVSTEPKMSAKVYLSVVVPKTELIGDQNRFVKAGSKVALHCIIRGTLEPPTYIIWFRGKTQLTDDMKLGWYTQIDRNIFGNTSDNQNTIGSLIIPFVRKTDSGNYTCQPSNSAAVSVDLHVLSGEYSASAIMSAARTYTPNTYFLLLILVLVAMQST